MKEIRDIYKYQASDSICRIRSHRIPLGDLWFTFLLRQPLWPDCFWKMTKKPAFFFGCPHGYYQMYKRITHMVRLGGFVGLVVILGACERYIYFWDDDPYLSGRPKTQDEQKKAVPGSIITVAQGDTLYGLARRYGLVLRDFISVNQLRPPYILQPGQKLKVPQAKFYTVSKGDTAYGIARRHGVDIYRLIQLNNLSSDAVIREGQRLKLPPPVVLSTPSDSLKRHAAPIEQDQKNPIKQSQNQARGIENNKPPVHAQIKRPKPRPQKSTRKNEKAKLVSPPKLAGKGFSWPVHGQVVLPYGQQAGGRFNDGINIAAQSGSDIRAAQNGVVVYVGNELPGFGNLIIVKHADGWTSAYAQCNQILVKRGQKVRKGQVIAQVGTTGNVSTPQLHFELRRRAQPVDPQRYLI